MIISVTDNMPEVTSRRTYQMNRYINGSANLLLSKLDRFFITIIVKSITIFFLGADIGSIGNNV